MDISVAPSTEEDAFDRPVRCSSGRAVDGRQEAADQPQPAEVRDSNPHMGGLLQLANVFRGSL